MDPSASSLIHIHGVSVGEILSAGPLIERLLAHKMDTKLLLTSWTETSQTQAKRLYGDDPRITIERLPLDLPWNHAAFYKRHAVKTALWVDSELWPGWLLAMRKRRIPIALINGRMSERSWKRWRLVKPLIKFLLSIFTCIDAQSAADAERFTDLGGKARVQKVNMKYLRTMPVLGGHSAKDIQSRLGDRPVMGFLFTQPGDEPLAFAAHRHLKAQVPQLLTLIVPRHPERTEELMKEAQDLGLNVAKRSVPEAISKETEILFGDTIGEMDLYLTLTPIVVIGKSLQPAAQGGQSPIESAQAGRIIVTGPYMTNFPGIMDDLREAKAVIELNGAAELLPLLQSYFADPVFLAHYGRNAAAMTASKTAAGPAYLDSIVDFLETAP